MTADTLTIGSLFSGIGGLDLGLECALRDEGFDVSTIWQCEQDAWCRGILARHWPDALRYDDVRTVGADAPRVDILCGGFPCQDVSLAGTGTGLAGPRSGLWFEFARIVREARPRIVVVENVTALASRGLDAVLRELSEAGYDAIWFDLRASDVGAPHERPRLFVVAYADAERQGLKREDDVPSDEGMEEPPGHDAHGCGAARVCGSPDERGGAAPQRRGDGQPRLVGGADGVSCGVDSVALPSVWPSGTDAAQSAWEPPRVTPRDASAARRLGAIGNAVSPRVAYVVGLVVAEVLRGSISADPQHDEECDMGEDCVCGAESLRRYGDER